MRFFLKALVVIFISTFMWGCSSVQPTSGSAQPKTTSSVDRTSYLFALAPMLILVFELWTCSALECWSVRVLFVVLQ
jgi:hypothetical protein